MKRRHLLKVLSLGSIGFGITPEILAQATETSFARANENADVEIKDYLQKIQHFNNPHDDDVLIDSNFNDALQSTMMRLGRLEKLVGHGNFHILSFAEGLTLADNYSKVEKFTKPELEFMETIFYEEGQRYGFFGQKPLKKITDQVKKNEIVKIRNSGNYLYKDRSNEIYNRIKKELGDKVVLTSGVRGVMKQFLLFLNKVYSSNGNLSLASRSLAPPGYSFHGNGDFDVGQAGYGALNFTAHFTETEVYKRLSDLGYLKLRYPPGNRLGVRFEPWHIKTNADV